MQADRSSGSSSSNSATVSPQQSQQQQQQQQQQQPPPPQQQQPEQPLDLLIEANRLATFKNWPNPNISPESLAKAGFFYLNHLDEVKCAWCKGVIAKWEKQDNAFDEHKRFFPQCPRVQLGPLIEMTSDGIRDLGIQQMTPPHKPKFSSIDARLRTYANWPITDIQRPDALAQAGLYYQDIDDHVRCFHCNIGLRSWQKEDDPWFEHAKWYPQCQFVRLVKGASYVQQVQDLTSQQAIVAGQQQCSMTLDEAMETAPVRQALEIGLDGGYIQNVTLKHLLRTGLPYNNVDDLVNAILDDRIVEESTTSYEEGGSGSGVGDGDGDGGILRDVSRFMRTILDIPTTANTSNSNSDDLPSSSSMSTSTSAADITNTPTSPTAGLATTAAPASESLHATASPMQAPTIPSDNTIAEAGSCATATTVNGVDNTKRPISLQPTLPVREPSPKRSLSLEDENRKLKDARLCKVCLDAEFGVVFLPCGHLVTCVQCAQGVSQCPICRTDIKGFVRTYLS